MIHSIILANLDGFVLLSKYFLPLEPSMISDFEQRIYNLTFSEWARAKEKQQIAVDGERSIVFTAADEVLVFVTGFGDDDDELALSELAAALAALLQRLAMKSKGKPLTEAALLENYAKICSALDVMVCNGVVNSLDLDVIDSFLRMEVVVEPKKK